ncbi:helicase-like protein, partial [Tanacetum coccineum]
QSMMTNEENANNVGNQSNVHTRKRKYISNYTARQKDSQADLDKQKGSSQLPSFDAVMTQASPITEGCIDGNVNPLIIGDNQDVDPYDFIYHGVLKQHRVLKEQLPCPVCGAKRIKFEFLTFCCMKGKTKLVSSNIPEELFNLFTSQSELGMYHRIDQLVPRDGQPRQIVEILTRVLATNPYVTMFRSLAELGPLDDYRVTLNALVELDQRNYNLPTTSEIARLVPTFAKVQAASLLLAFGLKVTTTIVTGIAKPLANFDLGEPGWHSKISIDEITGDEENIEEDSKVQDDGKPDIFLTMTCNPNWLEIQTELLLGQAVPDRPYLLSRVFRAKLEDLKEQLFERHVLGKDIDDFDLPKLNIDANLESEVVRELQEEYFIVVEEEHLVTSNSLNSDQRDAYDEILRHVDNDISGVFFIDSPGGM